MKTIVLAFSGLFLGIIGAIADDQNQGYDSTPLPPGPIIFKAPAFSQWQITFTYENPTAGSGNPSPPKDSHAPKVLTVIRTKPQWHSALVDVGGDKSEMYFDGATTFEVGPGSHIAAMASLEPGYTPPGLLYYTTGPDFPDVGWVSPGNYLGTQKDTTYWVFQEGPHGAMVWVDSNTHYPVRWQKGSESRTIQFLDAPTEQLVLPPQLEELSRGNKRLQELSNIVPPSIAPLNGQARPRVVQ